MMICERFSNGFTASISSKHPRYHSLAVPDGPFEIRLRTNGPAEAHELDRTIANMEASIARMRNGEALQEVRAAVRAYQDVTRIRY